MSNQKKAKVGLLRVMKTFEDETSTFEEREESLKQFLGISENNQICFTFNSECSSVFEKYKSDRKLKQILLSITSPNISDQEIKENLNKFNSSYPDLLCFILCKYSTKKQDEPNGVLFAMASELGLIKN